MKYDEICKNSAGPLTYMLRNVEATAPLMPYGFHEQIILTPAFMKSDHTISHISRYHRLRVMVMHEHDNHTTAFGMHKPAIFLPHHRAWSKDSWRFGLSLIKPVASCEHAQTFCASTEETARAAHAQGPGSGRSNAARGASCSPRRGSPWEDQLLICISRSWGGPTFFRDESSKKSIT